MHKTASYCLGWQLEAHHAIKYSRYLALSHIGTKKSNQLVACMHLLLVTAYLRASAVAW